MKYKNQRMFVVVTLLIFLDSIQGTYSVKDSPEFLKVDLQQGKIQGVRQSIGNSRVYYSFRGIPYAEPPIGALRFRDPVPASPWQGLRKEMIPPSCPQLGVEVSLRETNEFFGEEDCLYLNVYTPKPRNNSLPVMVFIHGGAFKFGNAEFMGGTPHRLLKKNVILVSIHYRLGILGFLSTGDSVIPGNFGLKDQTLALTWVRDNIKAFGGDPERITIFGESAGGTSVHYQMLTPYAEGLFKRVIMQSGSALQPWAVRSDHAEIAIKIGTAFGCFGGVSSPTPGDFQTSTQLLGCLRRANTQDLVRATTPLTQGIFPILMVPRVDGDYIPAHPALLIREGRYHKVDLISGIVQNEAASIAKGIWLTNQTTNPDFIEALIKFTLPAMTGLDLEVNSDYLIRRIFFHYMSDFFIDPTNIDQFEKFLAETTTAISQDDTSSMHARDCEYGHRVYRYEFQYRGQRSFADWVNTTFGQKWVAHVDDLMYLFDGVLGYPPIQQPQDLFVSDLMINLWAEFAKTGNPTSTNNLGIKWEPMNSPNDFRYLEIDLNPSMMKDPLKEDRHFWRYLPIERNELLFPQNFQQNSNVGVCGI